MRISTKGRYAIMAMTYIAALEDERPVSLCNIAQALELSEKYLEHLFSSLRNANLLKSNKGAKGGYELLASAKSITAGQVLRAMEGDLNVCNESAGQCHMRTVINSNLWEKMDHAIASIVDHITLDALAQQYKSAIATQDMYYI